MSHPRPTNLKPGTGNPAPGTTTKFGPAYHRARRQRFKQSGQCARGQHPIGKGGTATMCRRCADRLAAKDAGAESAPVLNAEFIDRVKRQLTSLNQPKQKERAA